MTPPSPISASPPHHACRHMAVPWHLSLLSFGAFGALCAACFTPGFVPIQWLAAAQVWWW